jgi:hypothetical protein
MLVRRSIHLAPERVNAVEESTSFGLVASQACREVRVADVNAVANFIKRAVEQHYFILCKLDRDVFLGNFDLVHVFTSRHVIEVRAPIVRTKRRAAIDIGRACNHYRSGFVVPECASTAGQGAFRCWVAEHVLYEKSEFVGRRELWILVMMLSPRVTMRDLDG